MFTATAITIFSLIVLLFSVIIHELAHGYVAYSLGDPTAKYEGRLTLNPIAHLDPFGSIILPLLLLVATGGQGPIFGWAKPVPVNPYNFRDQKWGHLKVSIAGPLTNFGIAIVFGLVIRFLGQIPTLMPFMQLMSIVVLYNCVWGIFNLVPIPPLDGSWILLHFLPKELEQIKVFFQQYGMYVLILLIFLGTLSGIGALAQMMYNIIVGSPFTLF